MPSGRTYLSNADLEMPTWAVRTLAGHTFWMPKASTEDTLKDQKDDHDWPLCRRKGP